MSGPEQSTTLSRLMKSGLCSAEDPTQYELQLRRLAEEVADPDDARRKSRFFKALADESRLRILFLLEARDMCVCELIAALDMTQPTVSHHLGILENEDLVRSRKEGKWVIYGLVNRNFLGDLRRTGIL